MQKSISGANPAAGNRYIEQRGADLHAVEFKWSSKASARFPSTFLSTYKDATTQIVSPENRDEFFSKI